MNQSFRYQLRNLPSLQSSRWVALSILLLSSTGLRAEDVPQTHPNVILIMTDDQGYGDLGCHGNRILKTPHMDALYADSVRLTDFHTDPTCSPTRASLLTGRYSTRTGVWHTVMGRHMPRANEILIPQYFAAAGYRTAMFGKWHLGDNYPYRPFDRGFQHAVYHGGGGIGNIPDYWGNDYFDDTYNVNGNWQEFKGYCTDVFFGEAMSYIRQHKEEPFFVYLATNAPHHPYRVDEKFRRPYADKVSGDEGLADFYGMIANLDENVGKLTKLLAELQLTDDTIVIFMTDNGTARGATFPGPRGNDRPMISGYNAGMRGKKGSPYEGGHRVPCFIRWPSGGIEGGRDVNELTAHLDLLPTLIELCNLRKPSDVQLDGRSLGGLLQGRRTSWPPRILFAHHQELPVPQIYRYCSVLEDKWRLVIRSDKGESPVMELFDLTTDPGQTKNLRGQHPQLFLRLLGAYHEWWKSLNPGFAMLNPIYLGTPFQPEITVTPFEWHCADTGGWQENVWRATLGNGFWAVDFARAGPYEFTLRRWPTGVHHPINGGPDGSGTVAAAAAEIEIGQQKLRTQVLPDAEEVRFTITVPHGPARLATRWLGPNGDSRYGAFYVTIKRVGT